MNGPETSFGTSRLSPAELQNKEEQGQQTAANMMEEVKNQNTVVNREGDSGNNFEPNAEVNVNHSDDLKKLPPEELEQRTGEAIAKLKSSKRGTDEYEDAFQKILALAKEKNSRHHDKAEDQEKAQKDQLPGMTSDSANIAQAKDKGENENKKTSLLKKVKKAKLWQKVVLGVTTVALVGSGIAGVFNMMNKDEAFADNNKIEQKTNQAKMYENEYGIQYNYDGLFGDASGQGYNNDKDENPNFAPNNVLGDVWENEEDTRQALIDLVERQPDLNGADYVCGLNEKDLNQIGLTESGRDIKYISNLMGTDKEFNQEATSFLKKIFNDSKTKVRFGRLTDFTSKGTFVNAGGVIKDQQALNDTNNVDIIGTQTYEDEHTAVVCITTENGSELLIKAGSFDDNGNFVQEDGCTQLIVKYEIAGQVFTHVFVIPPDTPPYNPYIPDTPEEPKQKDPYIEILRASGEGTTGTVTQSDNSPEIGQKKTPDGDNASKKFDDVGPSKTDEQAKQEIKDILNNGK